MQKIEKITLKILFTIIVIGYQIVNYLEYYYDKKKH